MQCQLMLAIWSHHFGNTMKSLKTCFLSSDQMDITTMKYYIIIKKQISEAISHVWHKLNLLFFFCLNYFLLSLPITSLLLFVSSFLESQVASVKRNLYRKRLNNRTHLSPSLTLLSQSGPHQGQHHSFGQ